MIIQLSVAAIALSLIILSIFAILKIHAIHKDVKKSKNELKALSDSGLELIENLNELAEDWRKKSESLNFLFRFLADVNKKSSTKTAHKEGERDKKSEQIAEIIDLVGTGVSLFNRIKFDIKKYKEKGRRI